MPDEPLLPELPVPLEPELAELEPLLALDDDAEDPDDDAEDDDVPVAPPLALELPDALLVEVALLPPQPLSSAGANRATR